MDSILLCDSDNVETTVDLCSERGFGVEFHSPRAVWMLEVDSGEATERSIDWLERHRFI